MDTKTAGRDAAKTRTGRVRARHRALRSLLALAVVGSALALGAVHTSSLVALGAVAALLAALSLRAGLPAARTRFGAAPFALLGLLAVATLGQAVPLPLAWVSAISPTAGDVWSRALLPFGEPGPAFATLSLDPGASLREALKLAIYVAVFGGAAVVASVRGAAFGVSLVVASALAVALVTLAHGLLGATLVYGVYAPTIPAPPWHLGPLVNPNNLAGYLNLGVMCGLGLVLMREPPAPRWVTGTAVALLVAVDVTSASRGGVVLLPVGVVLLGVALRAAGSRLRMRAEGVAFRWVALATLGFGGVLAALGGTSDTWRELWDKNLEKLQMVAWARPMIASHALVGIGRGAFESVFPAYRTTPGHVVFTHAENFVVQWLAEWGLGLGGIALVGVVALVGWLALAARRSVLAAGVAAGFVVLLAQNLADLGLEVPAVSIAATTALGSIWGDSRRGSRDAASPGRAWRTHARVRAATLVVAATFAGLLALVVARGFRDVASDRARAHEELAAGRAATAEGRAALRAELRASILRHPADPHLPLVGAIVAWSTRDGDPMPWLERSLERAVLDGRAHLLLAEVLAERGARAQAMMELRFAVHDDPPLAVHAARVAARWSRDAEELLSAAPARPDGGAMLAAIVDALPADDATRATRATLLREAIERAPELASARGALAELLVSSIAPDAPPAPELDAEIARHVAALRAIDPESSRPDEIRAAALLARGRADEAERLLAGSCKSPAERARCLRVRLAAAEKTGAQDRAHVVVKDLVSAGCSGGPVACASVALWAADHLFVRGEWGGALSLYERASREVSSERAFRGAGECAARIGAHARAADAFERALALTSPRPEALVRRIADERRLAAGLP